MNDRDRHEAISASSKQRIVGRPHRRQDQARSTACPSLLRRGQHCEGRDDILAGVRSRDYRDNNIDGASKGR